MPKCYRRSKEYAEKVLEQIRLDTKQKEVSVKRVIRQILKEIIVETLKKVSKNIRKGTCIVRDKAVPLKSVIYTEEQKKKE